MAYWKLTTSVAILLLLTQSSIQLKTIEKQDFLFKRLPDVAVPHHFTHVRIPLPLQPIVNKLNDAIREFTRQKHAISNSSIKDITDTMFENGIIALNNLKFEFDHLLRKFPAIPRSKRFFDLFGAFTGTIALGMSFYNSHSINQINTQIKDLQGKHNQLVDLTNLHENHLKVLDQETTQINIYWGDFFAHNPSLIHQHMQHIINEFQNKLVKLQILLDSAIQGKMPSSILPDDALESIADHLQELAKKQKLDSAVRSSLDLLFMDASYIFEGKDATITIILHCPFYDATFQAIQYQSIPLNFEKLNNSYLIPDVGINNIMVIRTEGYFFLTSEYEMSKCPLTGGIHFCKGRDKFQINLEETCIGAIYLQKKTKISEICRFIPDPVQEHTIRIGRNTHLVITPEEYLAPLRCKTTQTQEPIKIYNKAKIRVPGDCALILRSHVLVGNSDTIDDSEKPIHLEWDLDLKDLNQTINIPDALTHTRATLEKLESNITDFSILKTHGISTLFSNAVVGSTFAGIMALMIAIAAVQIFMCHRYHRRRNHQPLNNPIIKMQELNHQTPQDCQNHQPSGLYPNLTNPV